MSILFYCENDEDDRIQQELRDRLPDEHIVAWPGNYVSEQIEYAIVWQPPDTFFDGLSQLKAVFSLGAGVDHLLKHPRLPVQVPLVRLEDAGMAEKMEEYVLYGVLHAHRNMQHYRLSQNNKVWSHSALAVDADDFHVSILGLGVLGKRVAERLQINGYKVSAWSRTSQAKRTDKSQGAASVTTYSATEGLVNAVATADAVVCLLPLTDQTRDLINKDFISKCKPGCFLINAARGGHVVTQDLLDALNDGQLSGALLDVTDPEPLPEDSPLWAHPNVIITPHIAAPTQAVQSIDQVVNNIKNLRDGKTLKGVVNLEVGY